MARVEFTRCDLFRLCLRHESLVRAEVLVEGLPADV